MTRIPVPAIDEMPTASKGLLEWITQGRPGTKVLNMQAQLAVAPAGLAGYVALRRATEEHGTLDPKTRAAVLAMSGAALGVPYVERLMARVASGAGWQRDEIVRFTEGLGSGDEKLDSLLGVVGDAGKNLGVVDDAAWERAAQDGWTPEQLVESFAYFSIALYCAFTNFSATELDVPSVLPAEA